MLKAYLLCNCQRSLPSKCAIRTDSLCVGSGQLKTRPSCSKAKLSLQLRGGLQVINQHTGLLHRHAGRILRTSGFSGHGAPRAGKTLVTKTLPAWLGEQRNRRGRRTAKCLINAWLSWCTAAVDLLPGQIKSEQEPLLTTVPDYPLISYGCVLQYAVC